MEVAAADEDAIEAVVGVEPAREVEGGLNEQELAVGVPDSDGEVGERSRNFEEEEDDEPLIVEIVAVAELAAEVREVAGSRRDGEGEGLVLPYVVGGEGRERLEDLEVKRLQRRGVGGAGAGGGGIQRGVGEDGVENGIVWEPRGFLWGNGRGG